MTGMQTVFYRAHASQLAAIVTALRSISTSFGKVQHQRQVEKINSVVLPAHAEEFQSFLRINYFWLIAFPFILCATFCKFLFIHHQQSL